MLLIWRFFKKAWPTQLAVTILLTSAVTVFALYGAYIDRQSNLLGVRIESSIPQGVYLVELSKPQVGPNEPIPYRGFRPPPVKSIAGWRNSILETSLGSLLVAVLDQPAAEYFSLPPFSVALPRSLAESRGVNAGDVIGFRLPDGLRELEVVTIHDNPFFTDRPMLNAGPAVAHMQTSFLYENIAPEETALSVWRYMERLYPQGTVMDYNSGQAVAREIIEANYSPGVKARIELISFITLAFLSASLLSFLERRKILAILKAMGLRSREIAGMIAGEGILAPLFGAIFGGIVSTILLWWLQRAGMGVSVSVRIIATSMLSVIPAAVIGIAIPARFAQQATVNQLLFERPIPLITVKVRGLRRRWPALEPMMAQGIKFGKLETIQGHFEGFIFRKKGDTVKEGEVLAVANDWWGLQVREYMAPATGEIVFFDQESGFFGIMPEEKQQ